MPQVTVEKTSKYLIVKIPLKSVHDGRMGLSLRSQKVIEDAINDGLEDIAAGRIYGPFKNVKEFKKSLKETA